jgi:hypothetical protein
MTFVPSIQALIGDHTSSHPDQVAVDWANNNVYISGFADVAGDTYLASQGLLTGAEQNYALVSGYTPLVSSAVPVGVDSSQRVYYPWTSGFTVGGGLVQINGTTLAEITFGGSTSDVPNGFVLQNGQLANITFDNNDFILAAGAGNVGYQSFHIVTNEVTFAGRYVTWTGYANVCGGVAQSGLGYVAVNLFTSSVTLDIHKVAVTNVGGGWSPGLWPMQNPYITDTIIATLVPTDIDASWTEIYNGGLCVDQIDGHVLLSCKGQVGTRPFSYIVKIDSSSGAIIWKTATIGQQFVGTQMQYSSIKHRQFAYLAENDPGHTPPTVVILNTLDGSTSASYTNGIAGVSGSGAQCYNDDLGGIVIQVAFSQTTDSPTLLNSTPTSFGGWSVLYVAPPFTPGKRERRFLANCGPVRVTE